MLKLWKKLKFKLFKWLINDGEIYLIASALRGSDTQNNYLKEIFTKRLRHIVGCKYYRELTGFKIPFKNLVKAITTMTDEDCHYLDHIEMAFDSLIRIGYITDEIIFLRGLAWNLKEMLFWNTVSMYDICFASLNGLLKEFSEFIEVNQ